MPWTAPNWVADPRFATSQARVVNRKTCEALIAEMFVQFSSSELVQRLEQAGIPCGVVRTVGEALEAARTNVPDSIVDITYSDQVGNIPAVRIPIKFDGHWCPVRPAPALGQDNDMLHVYERNLDD